MSITIPDEVMAKATLTPEQLRIEIACILYDKQILSMGQSRLFADLDVIAFQKELAKRNYYIHFSFDDLKKDLKNLNL